MQMNFKDERNKQKNVKKTIDKDKRKNAIF